jgi:hypothetical protein
LELSRIECLTGCGQDERKSEKDLGSRQTRCGNHSNLTVGPKADGFQSSFLWSLELTSSEMLI